MIKKVGRQTQIPTMVKVAFCIGKKFGSDTFSKILRLHIFVCERGFENFIDDLMGKNRENISFRQVPVDVYRLSRFDSFELGGAFVGRKLQMNHFEARFLRCSKLPD